VSRERQLWEEWGYGGVMIAIPHIITPDTIAGSIGWEAGM